MRGIPRQAVEKNLPIKGTTYHAADVADKDNPCRWNPDMWGECYVLRALSLGFGLERIRVTHCHNHRASPGRTAEGGCPHT